MQLTFYSGVLLGSAAAAELTKHILFSHVRHDLLQISQQSVVLVFLRHSSGFFPVGFSTKRLYALLPHVCYIPIPFLSSWVWSH